MLNASIRKKAGHNLRSNERIREVLEEIAGKVKVSSLNMALYDVHRKEKMPTREAYGPHIGSISSSQLCSNDLARRCWDVALHLLFYYLQE